MREFQGKRTLKRVLYSRWFVFLLLVVLIIVGRSVWRVWQRSRVVLADRDAVAAQVAALAAREASLEHDLASLQTDRGKEELIREKFSVVKEGERVITVITPPVATSSTPTTSWWQDLWPF